MRVQDTADYEIEGQALMAISDENRRLLEELGEQNVRQRLAHAGPGAGSLVPGLRVPGETETLRGDVETWLAEKERAVAQHHSQVLFWARAATWVGVFGIIVSIGIAILVK